MNIQKGWIFSIFVLAGSVVVTPANAEGLGTGVTLDDLVNSSDVVISESAQGGAAVAIVAHPEDIEGGIALKSMGLTMQAIVAAWKNNDPIVGLGSLMRDASPGNPPVAGGGLIENGEFTTDLTGWTVANRIYGGATAYGGASSFGSIVAPVGSVDGRFAVVHTGTWDQSRQGSIEQGFRVNQPTSATFTVGYNFVTTEDVSVMPGAPNSQFNDNAIINVFINDGTGSVLFSTYDSRNSSTFMPAYDLPTVINGGRGQNGYQTGWQTASSGTLLFDRNTQYKVRIEVNDVSDDVIDSALLVDRIGLQ